MPQISRPSSGGTPANMVTTDTEQTITGFKSLTAGLDTSFITVQDNFPIVAGDPSSSLASYYLSFDAGTATATVTDETTSVSLSATTWDGSAATARQFTTLTAYARTGTVNNKYLDIDSEVSMPSLILTGLSSGTAGATRYVGGHGAPPPTSGAHIVGDWIVGRNGSMWVCTSAGTPGTWTQVGANSASFYKPSGLTGATAASRYGGATTSAAPTTGTWAVGDYVIAQNGRMWVCTVAGTPGTWVDVGAPPSNMVTTDTTQTISGAKTFSSNVTATDFITSASAVGPTSAIAGPYGSRMWNDKLRFVLPTTVEIAPTTTGQVWTTTGALTATQVRDRMLSGRTDTGAVSITAANPSLRVTWNAGAAYGNITQLLIGMGYTSPYLGPLTFTWESSLDGVTWTVRGTQTSSANAAWQTMRVTDHSDHGWFRLTMVGTGATGSADIYTFQAFSYRPGNQGSGEQANVPYSWSGDRSMSTVGSFNAVGGISDNGQRVYSVNNANLSATAPSSVATAAVIGTGTTYARHDHVHPGVDLTTAQTISGAKTFSAALTATANNAPLGTSFASLAEQVRTDINLMGGGTLTTSATGAVKWTARFIVIANGNGAHFSTSGFFDITMPGVGSTITGVGGATNVVVAADGTIPLASWHTLYYILPIGSASASQPANFRVANYTGALEVPRDWTPIAMRHDDGTTVKWGNGFIQDFGGTLDTTKGFGTAQFVALTGNQTIAGIKTFSSAPAVPDSSFTVAKISATGTRDTTTYLRGDGTFATTMTTSADLPIGVGVFVSSSGAASNIASRADHQHQLSATGTANATTYLRGDNTWAALPASAVTSVNTRTGAVTGLAEANAVVDLTNPQSISGVKTFTSSPVVPDSSFTIAKISATGTRDTSTFLRGDGTFAAPPGGSMTPFTTKGQLYVAGDPSIEEDFPTLVRPTTGWTYTEPAPGMTVTVVATATGAHPSGKNSLRLHGGNLNNNATVKAAWAVNLPAAGTVSFETRIDTELNYDFGRFRIDGVEQAGATRSGNGAWTTYSFSVGAGAHTLEWSLFKDGVISVGTDSFYVASIVIAYPGSPALKLLNVGASGTVLLADSAQPTGVRWGSLAVPISSITATGTPSATTFLRGDATWAPLSLPDDPALPTAGGATSSLNGFRIIQQRTDGNAKKFMWYFHEPQANAATQIWSVQTNASAVDDFGGFRFILNNSANPGRSIPALEIAKGTMQVLPRIQAQAGIFTAGQPFYYGGETGVDTGVGIGTTGLGAVSDYPRAQSLSKAWHLRRGSFYQATPNVTNYIEFTGAKRDFWIRFTQTMLQQTNPTLSLVADGTSTLAAGTYFYTVVAVGSNGKTFVASPPSIAVTAGNRVSVTWTAFTGRSIAAVTYEVYRGTSAVNMTRIASGLSATTTSFQDTGVAADATAAPTTNTTLPAFSWGTNTDIIDGAASATGVTVTAANTLITLSNGVRIEFSSMTAIAFDDLVQFTAAIPSTSSFSKAAFYGHTNDPLVTEIDQTTPRIGFYHGFTNYNNATASVLGYAMDMFRVSSSHWTGSSSTTVTSDVRHGSGALSGFGRTPFNLAGDRAIQVQHGLNADWLGTNRGLALASVSTPATGTGTGYLLFVNASGQLCFRGHNNTIVVLASS